MKVLDWLDAQQSEMEELLVKWCNHNSGSYNAAGVIQMGEMVAAAFEPLADNIEVIPVEPEHSVDDHGNVIERPLGHLVKITKRAHLENRVLLTGHLDTVYPKGHPFQVCQEKITTPAARDDELGVQQIKDRHCEEGARSDARRGNLNGPGVADMKGGLIVILKALEAFEQTKHAQKIGWTVLLNPDEEIGSPGSKNIFAQEAKQHKMGLVYEPSTTPEGALAGRRKGSGNFHFVVKGKTAHAGRAFDEGRNALVAASRLASTLDALNGQRENVTINVAKLTAGDKLNMVPDSAVLRVNIRTYIPEDQDWFLAALKPILAACHSDGISIEQHGGFSRPPRLLEGPVLRLFEKVKAVASELNLNLDWQPTGGVCDGNNLVAAGLPTVDTLGVRGALIHSPEEYICLESLSERARLSALLLITCADAGFDFLEE